MADPGFPVGGGVDLVRGAVDPRGGYISKILHVKTKESGPIGGAHTRRAPLDPPMIIVGSRLVTNVPNQAIGKSRMKVGDNIRKWRTSGVRKMQGVAQQANPTSLLILVEIYLTTINKRWGIYILHIRLGRLNKLLCAEWEINCVQT